jgi:hypothetical protein
MNTHKTKTTISIYDRIQQLLDQNQAQEALNLITHVNPDSPPMKNAQGVCLLRLGRIAVLREITFGGRVCIPSDTPVVYQTNFATAMLMANHKEGVMDVIERLEEKQHPAVARIRTAIKKWEKSLNLFQRLTYKAGIYPAKAIPIEFPPGDLE